MDNRQSSGESASLPQSFDEGTESAEECKNGQLRHMQHWAQGTE
jgi:hypothetical protein